MSEQTGNPYRAASPEQPEVVTRAELEAAVAAARLDERFSETVKHNAIFGVMTCLAGFIVGAVLCSLWIGARVVDAHDDRDNAREAVARCEARLNATCQEHAVDLDDTSLDCPGGTIELGHNLNGDPSAACHCQARVLVDGGSR